MRISGYFMVLSLAVAQPSGLVAQERPPIIDMHMHAPTSAIRTPEGDPAPMPCVPEGCEPFPTIVRTDEDVMGLVLEAMDRNNIVLAVVADHALDRVYQWAEAAPGRFLTGASVARPSSRDTAFLRAEFEAGRLQVLGEISTQERGFAPNDPALDQFFALAEDLDIPTLIHTEGIAGTSSQFHISHGHPELLEEVLMKHPNLRLWLENAEYPFLEEMIALMYRYPQVYADVSTITWFIPREEFWRYLRALMDAGLGSRLMFGSDQMNWPGSIDLAVEAIQSAPFLSEEQKRDIFYNNAARFLRLESGAN